jgi:hypothetical protein
MTMEQKTAFDQFAPSILQIYHRDKEAFWSAVMAPFLKDQVSFISWVNNIKVDVGFLSAFRGLDDQAGKLLSEFSAPLGFDITKWKSNRLQYFKDAYPVFAFLAVWMDEMGLKNLVSRFGDILRAGVFAVAGYGILDANVDSDSPSPVEILTAQALLAEYETSALKVFGISSVNLDIMHRMRALFLEAEIKEKLMRHKSSPYRLDRPRDLGAKGANSVTPFMLSLEQLGKASLIDDYWEVFLLFGAAIQMIDDWRDLEGDLEDGHYSYVTLGYDQIHLVRDAGSTARLLREDKNRVRATYDCSKEMIAQSRAILDRLSDPYLVRLVDVTEARLENYFHRDLHMN